MFSYMWYIIPQFPGNISVKGEKETSESEAGEWGGTPTLGHARTIAPFHPQQLRLHTPDCQTNMLLWRVKELMGLTLP